MRDDVKRADQHDPLQEAWEKQLIPRLPDGSVDWAILGLQLLTVGLIWFAVGVALAELLGA